MDTQTMERVDVAQMSDGSTAGKEMVLHDGGPQERHDEGQGQLPDGPRTIAQQNKAKLERVVLALEERSKDYVALLDAHGIDFRIFVAVLKQALIKVPKLLECSTTTILQAAYRCCADGLMPDGDEAAITPFKGTATYVPGYKGLLKCAYAMEDGNGHKVYKDIDLDVIYAGEEGFLKFRKGTDPFLSFEPPLNRDIEKDVIGAYAVVRTNNGGIFIEVIPQKELTKIASVNKASNGPRGTWGAEMHKKGPLRRVLKRTPRDQRLVQTLRHDEDAYVGQGAAVVDGDEIPNDKLFDDTAHKTGAAGPQNINVEFGENHPITPPGESADTDDAASELVAQARTDLMAADTEARLDEVIANIKGATSSSNRRKKNHFTPAERDELLSNAENLRAARFGGDQGGGAELSHAADLADGEQVAAELQAEAHDDDADAEGLEGISEAQDRLDAEMEAAQETFNPAPVEARPTETASAQSAAPSPASSGSATPASSASPAATSSQADTSSRSETGLDAEQRQARVEELQQTQAGGTALLQQGAKISVLDLDKHFQLAPSEARMTPIEAEMADPAIGVHFKRGVPANQSGQIPYFDKDDQILGFAKDDREIPWKDWTPGKASAPPVASGAATQVSDTSQKPSDTSTTATTAAQDGGAPTASPSEALGGDDYGEGEAPKAAAVYLMRWSPKEPPREFTDAIEWRDNMLWKMNALVAKNPAAAVKWWEDNVQNVVDAMATAKAAAGRVVTVAVAKRWAGAKELVDKHGPF